MSIIQSSIKVETRKEGTRLLSSRTIIFLYQSLTLIRQRFDLMNLDDCGCTCQKNLTVIIEDKHTLDANLKP